MQNCRSPGWQNCRDPGWFCRLATRSILINTFDQTKNFPLNSEVKPGSWKKLRETSVTLDPIGGQSWRVKNYLNLRLRQRPMIGTSQ
jgi:hypothetical protein